MKSERHFYEFGPYRLDKEEKYLLREGEVQPLTPKAFEVLLALVENSSRTVEKDDLMSRVWPDSCVEEVNLANNISLLRKVLGEGAGDDRYIQTVPRRGYRFVASVKEVQLDYSEGRIESSPGEFEKKDGLSATSQVGAATLDAPTANRAPTIHRMRWQVGIAIAVLLAVAATALYLRTTGSHKVSGEHPIKSIAVLPFSQSGGDSEYLGIGIADSLILRLSNLREIKVRPTSSVLKYNNQPDDPGQIGRELDVEAVLGGTVRRDGEAVRITVQLVRVGDDSPLWAEKFDDTFTSIFKIEDSMSRRVAESLLPKLTGEDKAVLGKRYTYSAEAYNEYLMGRLFWNKRTVAGIEKAIGHFDAAIALDPNYALAYAGLSDCHLLLYSYSDFTDKEEIPRAKAAATKALEIDTTLGEAHTSLGYVLQMERYDSAAEREYKIAIELSPNYATAYHRYASLQLSVGRRSDALQTMKRAQELDPVSLIINTALGHLYSVNGRYEEATEQLRKTLEMDPTFVHAHGFLGMVYLKRGMYQDAVREIEKARELSNNSVPPQVVSYRGFICAMTGNRTEAKKILKSLLDQRKQRHVSAPNIAMIYAGLGETDQAFAWLETAYREGELGFGSLSDPGFDGLRSDKRFADLAQKINIQH